MSPTEIFYPFFSMMLLTMVVWFYMYARRIPFIQKNNLAAEQMTPAEFTRMSPSAVANPSDNLKNLFELPVIFYAVCLYLYFTNNVDQASLVAAWVFVALRVLHSAVHCTVNLILLRFSLYCISAFSLWFMVIREAWKTYL